MGREHCWKRRKCWVPAFSPVSTMFSKGFFFKVVKSQDCVVKGYGHFWADINISYFLHSRLEKCNGLCVHCRMRSD